ncbi:MAG: hypothetical protein Q8P61_01005, partial [Candidatus Nanopelagicales bacterium]|nr:hypothetical protein [Candidatus Nanopelagicales bacterium]
MGFPCLAFARQAGARSGGSRYRITGIYTRSAVCGGACPKPWGVRRTITGSGRIHLLMLGYRIGSETINGV